MRFLQRRSAADQQVPLEELQAKLRDLHASIQASISEEVGARTPPLAACCECGGSPYCLVGCDVRQWPSCNAEAAEQMCSVAQQPPRWVAPNCLCWAACSISHFHMQLLPASLPWCPGPSAVLRPAYIVDLLCIARTLYNS